jgi:hypothetical protein
MTEPWFDPNYWAWLPGTTLGCLGGLWGGLAGILASQQKAWGLVFGYGLLFFGLAMALLGAGLAALATGQPYGVWYFLTWPGVLGAIGSLIGLCYLSRLYRRAEEGYHTQEMES